MARHDKSKLARAVEKFNAAFGHDLRLPATADTIERLAELCVLRDREDLAAALRAGLKEALV